jgi:hypothetical protein
MVFTQVQSSNISRIGYEASTNTMLVVFSDQSTYEYTAIPNELHQNFIKSLSKGAYLQRVVVSGVRNGLYTCKRIN